MQIKPWLEHYDVHVPHSLKYPKIACYEFLEHSAAKFPKKACVIFEGLKISYKTISCLSDHLAIRIKQMGLIKGDRVGLIFPNIPQFIITYFAILKAGGVVVSINPLFSDSEIKRILLDSNVRIVLCGEKLKTIFNKINCDVKLKIIVMCFFLFTIKPDMSQNAKSGISERDIRESLNNTGLMEMEYLELLKIPDKLSKIKEDVLPTDPAIFQYTGGTTGAPKAAVGLHRNIVANTIQFIRWCDLREGKEVVAAALPLFHVYGMLLTMNLGIALGASIVLIKNPRDVGGILSDIEKYKVTFYPGVPNMYYAINQYPDVKAGKYDLSSIRACISGSAALQAEVKNDFENLTGGKLLEGYGLSEAPTATHCNPLYGENRSGSIGLPLPDVDCRVVDIDTGKIDLKPSEIGELVIKGPQIMWGYHNMPRETKIVLKNGWLYTGDIVFMDEDGYFYIVDRKKSLIKVSGFQVWPNEIEAAIASHPGVKEVGVGGVYDAAKGERVIAWISLKENEKLNEKDIVRWCRGRLAPYKIPKEIYFLDALPRSGVGKILRRKLIEDYYLEH